MQPTYRMTHLWRLCLTSITGLATVLFIIGCATGPRPGTPEWHTQMQTKAAEYLAQCALGTICTYEYQYGNHTYIYSNGKAPAIVNADTMIADTQKSVSTRRGHSASTRNSQLVYVCGSAGLMPNFATGGCMSSSGRQTSLNNLYPDFQSPFRDSTSNSDLIMQCGGRGVDFVTKKCL